MTVAILFAVIALFFGMIIGLFVNNLTGGGATTATTGAGTGATTTGAAPLSPSQTSLPAGHPDVGMPGQGGATTGGSSSTGQ